MDHECLLHDRSDTTTDSLRARRPGGTLLRYGWLGVCLLCYKAGRVWHTLGKRTMLGQMLGLEMSGEGSLATGSAGKLRPLAGYC